MVFMVCGMVKNEGEPGGGPFWENELPSLPFLAGRAFQSPHLRGAGRTKKPRMAMLNL